MTFLVVGLLLMQFGPRAPFDVAQGSPERSRGAPLTPAVTVIEGTDRTAGEILLTCAPERCTTAAHAASKLQLLIAAKTIASPPRTIRVASAVGPEVAARSKDGRKAVAQMGSQQRASGEVLMMFANAIDREQRRMRSFEQFMPAPVDPILHGRIVDMENGITGVWASIGITPSPFVPPAQRIRGRGGEDRRVPSRTSTGQLLKVELPTAFLKFENVDVVVYELGNFIDGKRTVSDIRDAVSAEFTPIALPVVSEYFDRLVKAGAITIQ